MTVVRAARIGMIAFAMACSATPALAKERPLTPDEARIAQAFDAAVREQPSIEALARLPWASGASIWRPELLERLKSCKAPYVFAVRNMINIDWREPADPTDAARPCGMGGYFAILEMEKGRIKRVTFGEVLIVVT